MNILDLLLSAEFARAFTLTMFHTLWQGVVLALLASGLMVILRNHRPGIRYAILYIILLLLPVLFAGTFLITYDHSEAAKQVAIFAGGNELHQANPVGEDLSTQSVSISDPLGYANIIKFLEKQAQWVLILWFIGFLIFLLRFTGSVFYINRLKTSNVFPVNKYWDDKLRKLSIKIGLRKNVRLAESALALIPMTVGYLKPVILLPLGTLSGVPPQQIEAILLHELAHILRKDYLLNIIQSVVELLLFYHPLTWWLSGLIRQEREHICDDLAIGVNKDQINYIKALTTMESLNSKSPLLASAITGSKKKLLLRVKRLLMPVTIRKGFSVALISCVLLVSLIFTLSLNALSFIPSSFDLKGRESGERLYNMLPFNPNNLTKTHTTAGINNSESSPPVNCISPDTIISKSKSGKVMIKVITDSINESDEKKVNVFVECLDDKKGEKDHDCEMIEEKIIILSKGANQSDDNEHKIIVIKSGDSIKVIKDDTILFISDDFDTNFTSFGGYQLYEFEMPEMPELPELEYHYFHDGEVEWAEEYEKSMKEYEVQVRELEKDHRKMGREIHDVHAYRVPPDSPHDFEWTTIPAVPPIKQSEKIIRQELRDDGLTIRGKKYVIELDSKAMYINGEKQPKEVYRKYSKLVESLEVLKLEDGETYKIIF